MSARLRTVPELLLVTLLGSPLVTPLLQRQQVPCTHDGRLHYHRVVAMLHAWREGVFFSHWLPDLAFGYGYPFFLYREPLPLYLTLWPHLLGLPLPAAINLFYVVCILAAGCFTFLWVRDIFGAAAAVVAAVAYMAAPYQMVDALVRGNQVESMALALFPLILWAGRRFMSGGRVRWFLAATLSLAALGLSHNISLLLFAPALALYLLFAGWLAQRPWKEIAWRAALVLGLGLGMTAFYTVPAVMEIDEVTLTLSTSNRNNDFRFNFSSVSEILAPVQAEDPALINPPLRLRLGWAPAALALLSLISMAWNRRREQRLHVLFMAGGALLYLFFALPVSQPLWEALPLIEFVQFPWRFVGRAALPVAVLAGAPFAAIGGAGRAWRWRPLLAAGALALLVVEALPLLYPAFCSEAPYPTIQTVHEYEQQSGMVGVDPVGSYFPVTVRERPQSSPLLEDYAAGRAPQRFDESALPAGARLLDVQYEPLRARVDVESPVAFEARYLSFAFPGWTVFVDGEPVPIMAEDPSGLITFPVPAGRRNVQITWRLTPLRAALAVISALTALTFVVAAVVLARFHGREPVEAPLRRARHDPGRSRRLGVWAVVGFVLLGAKLLLVDQIVTPLRRSAAPPVSRQTDLAAGGLRLVGYDMSHAQVASGSAFDIDLAWRVDATPALALQSNIWLQDEQGLVWSDGETFRPRIYEDAPPTQQWLVGQWAWDSREVHLLSGTPPGRYEIVLTLFNLDDLQPLTLLQAGNAVGPTAVIGKIEVTQPAAPPAFQPRQTLAQEFAGLRLLGYNQDRDEGAPGDPLLLTLFWEKLSASESGPAAETLVLSLRDRDGNGQREWAIAPVRESYPPGAWQVGERLRGQHLLHLPASLPSGEYQFWLEGVALGSLQVNAPQRLFEEPAYDYGVGAIFSQQARLAGYALSPVTDLDALSGAPAGALTVTLVWQGLQEMPLSYHVFVHLVDGAGQILAQSDGEPAQWTRPTTGWAPGEYVIDEHVLALPAELSATKPALRIGLYDAASGQRLRLWDGADFVQLQP